MSSARTWIGHGVTAAAGGLTAYVLWFVSHAEVDNFVGEDVAVTQPAATVMPPQPDVILITVDTLRADRLGAYGDTNAKTPYIDAMARSGIVFTQTTVPLPRTTPGLASLHTGLTPAHHGSREVWEPIEHGTMLAEVFKKQGYTTIGLSANLAAGPKQGFRKGFDKFISRTEMKNKRKRDDADVVTRYATELLDKVDPDKPLFLWVHYIDPHWKYATPKKKSDPPPTDGPKCRALQAREKAHELTTGQITVDFQGVASEAFDDCSVLYDSEITFTDRQIGRLVDKLSDLGRWDDSIRVFTADHGENLGEDGYFYNHGPSMADASLRIPLIIAGPTVPYGQADDGITRIEDIVPTLVRMAGVPVEAWPDVDGVDMSWRWTAGAIPPAQKIDAAVAESGGALHLKAHTFIVSGRRGQQYCVNDTQYSMCFTSAEARSSASGESTAGVGGKDKPTAPTRTPPPATPPTEAAEDEDNEDDDHDAQPDSGAKRAADDEVWSLPEFFDRAADPELAVPLAAEVVPPDVLARLQAGAKNWGPETTRSHAVRTPDYKLVARPALEGGYAYALYDLRRDPSETTDIKERRPREFRQLSRILDRWQADLPIYTVRQRSADEIAELQGMGYL